jgi:hypothetical protein
MGCGLAAAAKDPEKVATSLKHEDSTTSAHDHEYHHRGLENGSEVFCGTPEPSKEAKEAMRAAAIAWETKQGPPGARQAKSYVIQTWIHVLAKDSSTGQMSSAEIEFMVTSLNKYFARSGFSFELAGSDTFENEAWFECAHPRYGGSEDYKAATRQGERDTLNVWVRGTKSTKSYKHFYSHFV